MCDVKAQYDQWHDERAVDAEADTPWHGMVRKALRPEDLRGRLLEIGCGRGGFACWLARQPVRPLEIVAADFSDAAVRKGEAFAATLGATGVSWKVRDIQRLDEPENSYDTVVSCETVEHVPDPPRAIAELARVLKPGGRLLLTTPNYLGPMGLYRAYLRATGRRWREEGQPINQLTMLPRTCRWMRRAGLKIVRATATGHYLLVPGRPPVRVPVLDRFGGQLKWFGLHSMVIATKPLAELNRKVPR